MISVALIHWPCMDKNGEEIATAITNLDLHDCARVCLTYGINTLYIVHPNDVQLAFARKIMDHWLSGFGSEYNPMRRMAFEVITLAKDIEEVREKTGAYMIGTSADRKEGCISFPEAARIASGKDVCLVFGTGWGIAKSLLGRLDAVLEPIDAGKGFNHLSVRSAE
ncbi:RNA methyltransferase [bacterium]|nr:RNA methyltransferase [bacterium]